MRCFSDSVAVGATTPVRAFSFIPEHFHSVVIRNDPAHLDYVYIGAGGVSSGNGFDLAGGEAVSFSYADFDIMKLRPGELVEIYAISGVGATTLRVFGFQGGR